MQAKVSILSFWSVHEAPKNIKVCTTEKLWQIQFWAARDKAFR